jgi:hypothetical protein
MAYEFILGIDVMPTAGSSHSVALTAVEKTDEEASQPQYRIERIEQADELDDPDAVAEYIQSLITQKPYVARTVPVINRTTAAGQAVHDALADRGLKVAGVTLSRGTATVSGDRGEMNASVAVRDAVDMLQALYHDGRLDVEPQQNDEASSRLLRAIEWFSDSGTDESGKEHRVTMPLDTADDRYEPVMVSTMVACWLGEEQTFNPTERLKEALQGGPSA